MSNNAKQLINNGECYFVLYSQMARDFRVGFRKCVFRNCVVYSCGLDMEAMALPVHSCMNGKMREFSLQMRFIRRTHDANSIEIKKHTKI